jgi:hypothetical protein
MLNSAREKRTSSVAMSPRSLTCTAVPDQYRAGRQIGTTDTLGQWAVSGTVPVRTQSSTAGHLP